MAIVDLYNGIYKVLAFDEAVLNYLGIGESADPLTKAKRIQKRAKPQDIPENLPVIAFYTAPGKREGRNSEVYVTNFIFDIYTNDDVPTAQDIGQRIIDLFEGEIPGFRNVETFAGLWVSAYEGETDLANTYCFTVVIQFSISMERFECT